MQCVVCKTGEVMVGITMIALQRGDTTVVIKNVPASACGQCGEYYLSEAMTGKVLEMAEAAVANGAEVEVPRWAA